MSDDPKKTMAAPAPEDEYGLQTPLPDVGEIDPRDTRMRLQIIRDGIQKLFQTTGHIAFVYSGPAKPGRVDVMAQFGYQPLRWSDLKPKKVKELSRLIPYRSTDHVTYADTLVMIGKWDAMKARQRYKETLSQQRMAQAIKQESPEALSRELGIKIEDPVKW